MTFRAIAIAALALVAASAPGRAAGLEKLWELDGLAQPESAAFDASGGVIYVSEVGGDMRAKDGNGRISKVSPEGKIVQSGWITGGLNAPKGIGLSGGKLYVADIDELVEIDIAASRITARHKAEGAQFLNDVATDPAGRVFVSDTATNTIWTLQDGKLKTWLRNDGLNGPNGLAVEGEAMIIASFGKIPKEGEPEVRGQLWEAPLSGDTFRGVGDGRPVGWLDGLVPLGGGRYFVTDYIKGSLYVIAGDGSFETVGELGPGAADAGFDPATRTAFVPQNREGKLIAFKLP